MAGVQTVTTHPPRKMLLDLVSVEGGWQRVHWCEVCGRRMGGHVGAGTTVKGVKWCNGVSVKGKPQPDDESRGERNL